MLAFVLLALLLRLPLLGRSIWFDEACMSHQRIGTWPQLLATLYVDVHPPLYVVFMHFWNAAFGDSEWSMRLPPLLAGLASIPLLYWCGERLAGRKAALWAALLLCLSPVHIWYSAEARLYAPMVASTLLAIGTFDRLLADSPRRWWLAPLHLANLAVMLSLHYYLAVYVALLGTLAPLVARGFTAPARRIMLWHGIGILLLGAFVAIKRAVGHLETSQDYLRALTPMELFRFMLDWCWCGHTLIVGDHRVEHVAAYAQQGLGALLAMIGLGRLWFVRRLHPRGFLVPIALLTLPVFLMVVAALGFERTYLERSVLPALPFVFLLAGSGLAALPRLAHPIAGLCVLLLAAASLVALYSYQDDRWTVYKPNSDWRAAATYLGSEIHGGASGRPVFTSTPNPRPLSYYDARIQDVKNLSPAADPAKLGDTLRSRVSTWLGDYAERIFTTFAADNQRLLDSAALRIYRCSGDPTKLSMPERGRDDVCYLVRDHWHPHRTVDGSVEDLLKHPHVMVLEAKHFTGMSVYKVRIAP
ncbi:MAG: glycosyltransferase family 39 protein [Planctomycetota bacterium]